MSGYDKKFDDALIKDADFDNMIDADDEDAIIAHINNEAVGDDFIKDVVDVTSIENGPKGLGDDLGTKHPSKGAEAPTADSSHETTVVGQKDSKDVSEVINHKVDGQKNDNPDPEHIAAEMDKVDKPDHFEIKREDAPIDSFEAAKNSIIDEAEGDAALNEEEIEASIAGTPASLEDIVDDVDAATGADTPVDTSPNDIPVNDGYSKESVLSVGEAVIATLGADNISENMKAKLLEQFNMPSDVITEGKFKDLAIGDHAEAPVKDGNVGKINDFMNVGEDRKDTVKDGKDLAVGNNAEGSVKDGGMVKDFLVDKEDRKGVDDDFREAAKISNKEDLVDELEDEDIDFIEDNNATASKLAAELADEEDEEDDLLDELLK